MTLATYLLDAVTVGVVLISVYTDLKERKIYNKVIATGIVAGLMLHALTSGTAGIIFSLKGLGAGLGLLFVPFVLGGFGAGDVKLMGAVGALKGPYFAFNAFLATGITGGIFAIAVLIKQKRLLSTLKRIALTFLVFIGSRFRINTLKSLDKAEYHESLPYGLAIGIGTFVAYLMR